MRSGSFCGLGLMMALGSSLHADWKITTVATAATGQQIQTEYFKDGLKRTDFRDGGNGPLRSVAVIDVQNHRQTIWDVTVRQYMVRRLHTALRYEGVAGPVIVIDIETTDTGERRTMFGHTARHVLTLERSHTESRPGVMVSQGRTDGWYIDSDSLPPGKHGDAIAILSLGNGPPLLKVNRQGPAEKGLALWQRKTTIRTTPGGQMEDVETTFEVTELFEGVLEKTLFEPPPGFEHVVRLPGDYQPPWGEQMRLRWEWFQEWVYELFK